MARRMTHWELAEFSTPPDFKLLSYEGPVTVAMGFLKAADGNTSYYEVGSRRFELEGEVCVFISALFVSAADPFAGACASIGCFNEETREESYDGLLENSSVFMSPMPVIKKWLAASEAFSARCTEM